MNIKKVTEQLLQDMQQLEEKQQKIEKVLNQYFTPAEQVILNYEVSIGRKESVLSDLSEEGRIVYSNMCQGYLRFGQQVDACLEHTLPKRDAVRVCSTPQLLLDIGLKPLEMHITQRHLIRCMRSKNKKNPHDHGLTKEEVKRIPEALENPVMIAESFTQEKALIVVLGYRDFENLPVIVSIALEGEVMYRLQTGNSNVITSAYGKEHAQNFVDRIVEQNKLLYINNEKSRELALLPLQLRQGHLAPAPNGIIRQIGKDVNAKTELEKIRSDVQTSNTSVQISTNIKL